MNIFRYATVMRKARSNFYKDGSQEMRTLEIEMVKWLGATLS